MKNFNVFLFLASMMSILVGCQDKIEAVQTVDWYVAHEPERKAKISECRNNPGALSTTPNCVNAQAAFNRIAWSSTGGINLKPLKFNSKMEVAQ